MPTETLPAEDMVKASERLNGIFARGTMQGTEINGVASGSVSAPVKRRTRSDAGKSRPEKPKPAPAGVLTKEQVAHIDKLVDAKVMCRAEADKAHQRYLDACTAYYSYLAEITAK